MEAWLSDELPTGTTASAVSVLPSIPTSAFTSSSAKPAITSTGCPPDAASARRFAMIIPASQKRCRYPLAPYFHAVLHGMPVRTSAIGAAASESLPPHAVKRAVRGSLVPN
jgi:hypothetical protein